MELSTRLVIVILVSFLLSGGVALGQGPDIAEGLFRNAQNLLGQAMYEQALADFWKIVRLYPTSDFTDDALYLIGKHHFDTREYEKSLEATNQVINNYANLEWAPAAYYLKAEIYMDTHFPEFDYKVAYANYSRIFSIYRESEWVDRGYYGAGLAAYKMLDYVKAGELFHEVTEQFPGSQLAPDAQFYQGMCSVLQGDTLWALQAFQKVIDRYPDRPIAERALGLNTLLYKTRFLPQQKKSHNYTRDLQFRLDSFTYKNAEIIAIRGDGVTVIANGDELFYWFDADGKQLKSEKAQRDVVSLSFDEAGDLLIGTNSLIIQGGKGEKFYFQRKTEVEQLEKIGGVISDLELNLYIVDGKYDGILQFDKDGKKVSKSWTPASVKEVGHMTRDFEGSIFFVNDGTSTLQKMKSDGSDLGKISREGAGYKMRSLDKVVCDPIGNIYILDTKTPSVFVFSRDLAFIQEIQLEKKPVDIGVNYRGEILIINSREKSIQRYL